MPDATMKEIICEVYIEPIKSVLFIDDQFPSYKELISNTLPTAVQIENVEGVEFSEDLGNFTAGEFHLSSESERMHDNGSSGATVITPVSTNNNSTTGERDRARALTESCRSLGYIFDIENNPSADSDKFINKADVVILDYLLDGEGGEPDKCLSVLKKLNESDHFNLVIIYSSKESSDIQEQIKTELGVNNINDFSGSELKWVKAKNVFIAIAKKPVVTPETFEALLGCLIDALCAYKPSPIMMLLTKGVNVFNQNKDKIIKKMFADDIVRSSILYHILSLEASGTGEDDLLRLKTSTLIKSTFSELHQGINSEVSILVKKILEHIVEEDHFEAAYKYEKVTSSQDNSKMVIALNSFLCSSEFQGNHFTTGTVFRSKNNKKYVWLCVSPSCDMVPRDRKKRSCHRGKIDPYNYFEAIRISPLKGERAVRQALENAENCRHIFVNNEIFEVMNESSREPNIYIFYTPSGGKIADKTSVNISQVVYNADIRLESTDVEVIGQLRQEYADRFLQQKGSHSSRIGVDFRKLKQDGQQNQAAAQPEHGTNQGGGQQT